MPISTYDISVICPCYNSGTTVLRALNSILRQSSVLIEVIIIDDFSMDDTVSIIHQFISSPEVRNSCIGNIVFIRHERNLGAAASYSDGLSAAKGDYVIKLDADDEFCDNALTVLFRTAVDNNAQIVSGKMIERYTDCNDRIKSCDTPYELNNLTVNTVNFSLCTRLISRKLITDNDFYPTPGIDCWEDLSVVSRVMSLEPVTALIDNPVYIYYQFPDKSLSHSKAQRLLEDHLKIASRLTSFFEQRNLTKRYSPFINYMQFCSKIKLLRSHPRKVKEWKETFPTSNCHILSYHKIPLHLRLLFFIINILPTSFSQRVFDILAKFIK